MCVNVKCSHESEITQNSHTAWAPTCVCVWEGAFVVACYSGQNFPCVVITSRKTSSTSVQQIQIPSWIPARLPLFISSTRSQENVPAVKSTEGKILIPVMSESSVIKFDSLSSSCLFLEFLSYVPGKTSKYHPQIKQTAAKLKLHKCH